MSDFENLEEIADQTTIRVNQRTRARYGWSIAPNIDNASAAREKIAEPRSAGAPPSPATPPTGGSMRNSAALGQMFTDYRTLIQTCRARADELALSRLELDRLSGLPSGYSAKLLGKVENTKDKKRIWPVGLGAMLGTLGLRMLLIEDEAATARTLALRDHPVDRSQQRFGNVSRIKRRSAARKHRGAGANAA